MKTPVFKNEDGKTIPCEICEDKPAWYQTFDHETGFSISTAAKPDSGLCWVYGKMNVTGDSHYFCKKCPVMLNAFLKSQADPIFTKMVMMFMKGKI